MSIFCSGALFFEKNNKKFIDFNYFPLQIRCKFEEKYHILFTLNISNRAMDNESAERIDLAQNSSENQSARNHETEDVCTGNDYFDCKNCGSTFWITRDQENVNPNGEFSGTCKSCTAKQKFQNSLSANNDESALSTSTSSSNRRSIVVSASRRSSINTDVVAGSSFTSPLTANSSSNGAAADDDGYDERTPSAEHTTNYAVGDTHILFSTTKAPKNSSNFSSMNLYQSIGVYDQDLEMQLKDGANEKRIEKFYVGVDVIYKTDERKVFCCLPLLCPAKVHYHDPITCTVQSEIIVGIFHHDGHNSNTVAIIAIYDAFHQFKNLAKSRSIVHSYFARLQPTSITYDFSADERALFSKELYKFLNLKTPLQEKEGDIIILKE